MKNLTKNDILRGIIEEAYKEIYDAFEGQLIYIHKIESGNSPLGYVVYSKEIDMSNQLRIGLGRRRGHSHIGSDVTTSSDFLIAAVLWKYSKFLIADYVREELGPKSEQQRTSLDNLFDSLIDYNPTNVRLEKLFVQMDEQIQKNDNGLFLSRGEEIIVKEPYTGYYPTEFIVNFRRGGREIPFGQFHFDPHYLSINANLLKEWYGYDDKYQISYADIKRRLDSTHELVNKYFQENRNSFIKTA